MKQMLSPEAAGQLLLAYEGQRASWLCGSCTHLRQARRHRLPSPAASGSRREMHSYSSMGNLGFH